MRKLIWHPSDISLIANSYLSIDKWFLFLTMLGDLSLKIVWDYCKNLGVFLLARFTNWHWLIRNCTAPKKTLLLHHFLYTFLTPFLKTPRMKAILPHFVQLIDHHLSLVSWMILFSNKMKSSPIFFVSQHLSSVRIYPHLIRNDICFNWKTGYSVVRRFNPTDPSVSFFSMCAHIQTEKK